MADHVKRSTKKHNSNSVSYWLSQTQKLLCAFFVLTLPLLFYVGNTNMSYTKAVYLVVAISCLLILWAFEAWFLKQKTVHLPMLLWPGLAIVVAGALSVLNATSTGIALEKLGMVVLFGIFYIYIANLTKSRHTFFLIIGSLSLSFLLVSVYGFLHLFGWVQKGEISGGVISTLGNPNAVAEFVNSLLFLVFTFFVIKSPSALKVAGLLVCAFGWGVFAVVNSTGAWGSVLVAIVALGLAFVIFRKKLHPLKRFSGWLFAVLLVAVTSVLMFNNLRINPSSTASQDTSIKETYTNVEVAAIAPPLKQINPFDYLSRLWQSNDGQIRLFFWLAGLEMVKDHPWFGVGLGHYEVQYIHYRGEILQTEAGQRFVEVANELYIDAATDLRPSKAHNDYVQAIAEMGWVGAIAVAAFLLTLMFCGIIQIKRQPSATKSVLLMFIYVGVVAFLADAFVNFPIQLPASSLNFVLLLGLAHSRYFGPWGKNEQLRSKERGIESGYISASPQAARKRPSNGSKPGKIQLQVPGVVLKTVGAILAIGGVFLIVLAARDWQANVHLVRGIAFLENNLLLRAEEELEKSLELSFAPVEVLYHLGTLNAAKGDYQAAFSFFDRSLKIRVFEDTLWRLANLHFLREEFSEAKDYIQRLKKTVLEGGRTYLEARYLEATIALHAGDTETTAQIAEETLAQYPDYEKMVLVWGDAAFIQKNYALACSLYQRGLAYVEEGVAELGDYANEMQAAGNASVAAQAQQSVERLQEQRQGILTNLQALQAFCD